MTVSLATTLIINKNQYEYLKRDLMTYVDVFRHKDLEEIVPFYLFYSSILSYHIIINQLKKKWQSYINTVYIEQRNGCKSQHPVHGTH